MNVGLARSRFDTLTPMLRPRSVAVLGASSDPVRIGGRPIAYMLSRKFDGPIYPVNPKRDEVQGLRAYPSVADLPTVPDVAIVAVPASAALRSVDELGRHGVRAAIVFTAGFAEMDAAGAVAQAEMVALARGHGMRLLGPNCLGVFNAPIGFFAMFSSSFENGWPIPGRIGIASQSGAYGTHVFAAARDRRMGTPICVTTGNEADVTIGDVIGWMVENPDIDVIAAYAEGMRESASLLAALAAARAARKPIVMMKVGRSVIGSVAAQSHTASIAGDDAVTEAVMREFGVVRARTTEEMLDIAVTATRRIYPARNTLGVLTISGGAGVLISDAAEQLGLAMPEMPAATQARLKAMLPFAAPRNPVDCTAQAFNDMSLIGRFGDAMVEEGGYSSVLAFFTQVGASPTIAPSLRAQMNSVRAKHSDRLYVMSILAPPARVVEYEEDGFVVFEDPTRATVAIHAMGLFGKAFARPPGDPAPVVPPIALPDVAPSEAEAKRLLARAGIAPAPERACRTADEAVAAAGEFGFPVVLKIISPDIVHKSDIGGVMLGVADADAVRAGFATILARVAQAAPSAKIDGVLVAKQVGGGLECILGIHRDPVFGPIAMFGLGGIFVEILHDVVFRRCPFGEDVAAEMIVAIKGAPLLMGARGRPKTDIGALAAALARLSVFAHQAGPRLRSIDLNPVFAMPEGEGVFVADAVIELDPP